MIEDGVRIIGNVHLGDNVSIAAPCEVNGKDSSVSIGDGCDIAAGVTITCADSHRRCVGRSSEIERLPIRLGVKVYIGADAIILGNAIIEDRVVIGPNVVIRNSTIGHDSTIWPNVVLIGTAVPPYSWVRAADPVVLPGHYAR